MRIPISGPPFSPSHLLAHSPSCLSLLFSLPLSCPSLAQASDTRFTLGFSPSRHWRAGSWKPSPFSGHGMATQGRAPTSVSSCDLGAMSQQTDKHIAAAVVHHLQAEAPPSLDLHQAFCHAGSSSSLSLFCLSWAGEATTSHSSFDLSVTVHSVLKDRGRAH